MSSIDHSGDDQGSSPARGDLGVMGNPHGIVCEASIPDESPPSVGDFVEPSEAPPTLGAGQESPLMQSVPAPGPMDDGRGSSPSGGLQEALGVGAADGTSAIATPSMSATASQSVEAGRPSTNVAMMKSIQSVQHQQQLMIPEALHQPEIRHYLDQRVILLRV